MSKDKITKKPKVSVVMPVYNGAKFIKEAVDSILKQTFKDFELIIIDDGSTDGTLNILTDVKDKRLDIIINRKNVGPVKSLNRGIAEVKGEYIARCDADDINFLERFKIQVEFLDTHPDYALAGSNALLINEKGKKIGMLAFPETDLEIRKKMIIKNIIIHSSVMMRTRLVKKVGAYREIFNKGAEEYDLWFRLLKAGKLYNLPEILIKRRINKTSFTAYRGRINYRLEFMALVARIINLPEYIQSYRMFYEN